METTTHLEGCAHHKDASPEATVARIRELLASLGVELSEFGWSEGFDGCCSLGVTPSAFLDAKPRPSTNGKGMTKELARASAYAEFMERLQNSTRQIPHLINRRYGLMEVELADPPDACSRTVAELVGGGSFAAQELVRLANVDVTEAQAEEHVCYPFFNATLGTVELLPAALLYRACSSNGMAAGNSPEEALVQALGEILERYAARRAFYDQLRLPTIPLDDLAGLRAHATLRRLVDAGLRVMVKDCSLGGRYPVVAVVLYDSRRNSYKLKFGSDPVLDVALQRCLTEIFQGVSAQDLDDAMLTVPWHDESAEDPARTLSRFTRDGMACFPSSILATAGEPRHREAFVSGELDNRGQLRHLLEVLRREGYQVLVRDASYLGFPSYYVYVPRMSEGSKLPRFDGWEPQRFLARLGEAAPTEIARWLDVAETKGQPGVMDSDAEHWFGLLVGDESGIPSLYCSDLLIAELACRAGQYGRALRSLSRYIAKVQQDPSMEIENLDYSWCTLAALRFRALGLSDDEEAKSLAALFGESLAEEVRGDLASPSRPLANRILPTCGGCSTCALAPHCYYEPWRTLVEELNRRMAASRIVQGHLAAVVAS